MPRSAADGLDAASPAPPAHGRRWVSPLLRRILLLNILPPALLAAAMLYLDQYQNGLLAAEVEAMRTQARIYAGAIAEAATRLQDDRAVLVPEAARPLLRRLVDPSPNTQARLFEQFHAALAPGGYLVLGKVETLLGRSREMFAPVDARERIFRRP